MPLQDPDARRAYHREYMKGWYQRNKAIHRERCLRVTRRLRADLKRFLDEVKGKPCADCGVTYPPVVMDFDHVRGTKVANVSYLRGGRISWVKILAEIEKCDVVCANCHRLRTYTRRRDVP